MDVLNTILNQKFPTLTHSVDIPKLRQQLTQLVLFQQSDTLQHGDVGHGAQYIILGQIEIHLTVTSYGEALYLLINLVVLLPKFHYS